VECLHNLLTSKKGEEMKVKIKTWEQMEQEFGLDDEGNIACKGSFISGVEKIIPDDRIICLDDERYWHNYFFHQDMIEEIIEK